MHDYERVSHLALRETGNGGLRAIRSTLIAGIPLGPDPLRVEVTRIKYDKSVV